MPASVKLKKNLLPWLPVVCVLAVLIESLREFRTADYIATGLKQWTWIFPPYWTVSGVLWRQYALTGLKTFWITSAFWGAGNILTRRFGLQGSNKWEGAALDFALGSGLWGLLFFLLGLAQFLIRPFLEGCLVLGGFVGLCRLGLVLYPIPEIKRPGIIGISGVFWALIIFQGIMLLPYALVPETFYDSLEYHLGLPALYLLRQGITAMPDNAFSGVPNFPSMLFGWGLIADKLGDVSHLLNFSFLAWTSVALIGLAGRFKRVEAGVLAALIFLYIPIVCFVASFTQVELYWGFLQITALSALFSLTAGSPSNRSKWAYLAGFLLGIGMSAKYLAWGLPAAFICYAWSVGREARGFRRKEILKIAVTAGVVLSPWILKNIHFYGNPLYPFLNDIFRSSPDWSPGTAYLGEGARLEPSVLGWGGYIRRVFSGPWRMVHYEQNPGDSVGPLFYCLMPLWFFTKSDIFQHRLRSYLMGCVFPLLFVTDLPRYYIPAFGLLALAFVLPIFDLERGSIKRALKAIVVFAVVISGFCIWSQVVSRTRWPVFTGKISRDRFLSNANKQYYPSPSYPGFKWLNDHASPDARVLVFDDSRSFYLERDFINSTPHQVTVLERWSNQSGSGLELREKFASEGITHILVNHAEIIRQQKKFRFTVNGKKSLDEFWRRYTLKVHQTGPTAILEGAKPSLNRWVVVYRVLSEREAALPHETDSLFAAYKTEL